MFWQFRNDEGGKLIKAATNDLIIAYRNGEPGEQPGNGGEPGSQPGNGGEPGSQPGNGGEPGTQPGNGEEDETESGPSTPEQPNNPNLSYPIRLTWIDALTSWWPETSILRNLGVPGYGGSHGYNVLVFDLWSFAYGATGVSPVWTQPLTYLGSILGTHTQQIQNTLLQKYRTKGIKVLISVFG